MITYDSHTHSAYSFDCEDKYTIEDMCLAAVSKGITHLAITDHYDINAVEEGIYPSPDFYALKAQIKRAEDKYKSLLTLSFGVELGSAVQYPEKAIEFLNKYNFETVVASVHYMRGHDDFCFWDMKSLDKAGFEDMWLKYLADIEDTVDFGRSDILAHLTYPLRYAHLAKVRYDISFSDRIIERILTKVIKNDMLLEVNASGFRQGMDTPLPDGHILTIYKECGGRLICVGSDAHSLENIGACFDKTRQYLKKYGFDKVCFAKNKEIYTESI